MARQALTEDQKRAIRNGLKAGMTHRAVAAKVGVSAGVVQSVKTGRDRAGEKARREAREKAAAAKKSGTGRTLKIERGAKRTDKGPGAKRYAGPAGQAASGISKRVKVTTGKKGQGKA